ncbi:MAG: DUF362 domain-containing protein [Firmicutes bacterium]|nr:DUF362 domain-containing protein [Bacillota bacterium]
MAKVVVNECSSYDVEQLVEKIDAGLELIGGWERFVKPDMTVLLKVNLITPKGSDSAAITHVEFVRAITKILRERGCSVWIGDSSGGAIAGTAPTARSFIVSGLAQMAEEEGAQIKNFDLEGVRAVGVDNPFVSEMHLAKPVFEADLVINLPKLKTHSGAVYTGAVKNLYGLVPGLKKADYHRIAPNPTDFGQVIASIHKATNVQLHIMDGISAMQGEGPTAGVPYKANKILISTDPLALDAVAIAMMGLVVDDVPILTVARNEGLGQSRLNEIGLLGDYESVPRFRNFRLPRYIGRLRLSNYRFVSFALKFLKTRPKINARLCRHCGVCVESCPVHAIDAKTKIIDYSTCIECMCCHELCGHQAVELRKDYPLAGALVKLYQTIKRTG